MKFRVFSINTSVIETFATSRKAVLFALSLWVGFMSTSFAQSDVDLSEQQTIRMALLPFCNESSLYALDQVPDNKQFYNYTLSGFKELSSCGKRIEWISKNRLDKVITSRITRGTLDTNSELNCGYSVVDSICEQFTIDLLVVGEYILNANHQLEVYYSYETCEGLNAANIEYLTQQPLIGSPKNLQALYQTVADAIRKDLASYLSCNILTRNAPEIPLVSIAPAPISRNFEEGYQYFLAGDSLVQSYKTSIKFLGKIQPGENDYANAQYHIALSHLSLGEYAKAKEIFEKLGNFKKSATYLQFASLRSKPAEWFDSKRKRRAWWNELSPDWRDAFCTQTLHMPDSRVPNDDQLLSLFQLTRVRFEEVPLVDLSGLRGLSNLTHVTLFKTGLRSLDGIECLPHLQRLNCNKNKLKELGNIDLLPKLEYLYIRQNPVKSLAGLEEMDQKHFTLFCSNSVPLREILRIREIGVKVQL